MAGPVRDRLAEEEIARRVAMAERKRLEHEAEQHKQMIAAAERALAVREARDDLIRFTELTMPDLTSDDPLASRYKPQPFHRALANALEQVERGEILRLIVTFPPRHGKSELCNKRFIAWAMGRDPYRSVALGTYGNEFAEDWGQKIREIMLSPAYQQIFPNTKFQKGGQSVSKLITTEGGTMHFVGRGGTITGRGADIIVIDDPIKDAEEAASPTIRDKTWTWFTDTFGTRFMTDMGALILIMTRWHEDDVVGRLTDPRNPHYNADVAAQYKIINIRALAESDDVLGRPVGEPLWPGRFGKEWLDLRRKQSPKGFSALYQQRPSPEEGTYFKVEWIREYNDELHLPENLRLYGASDHAVGQKQEHDKTCLGVWGVDENDELWQLPIMFWEKAPTDVVVEAMIGMMQHPLVKHYGGINTWFATKDHIAQSIGPFLRKRMREEAVYVPIHEMSESKDKQVRAQSFRGRAAMGMTHFPKYASWWGEARSQLLTFPQATHDDYVDMCSLLGRGLDWIGKASSPKAANDNKYPSGTWGWVKEEARRKERYAQIARMNNGW